MTYRRVLVAFGLFFVVGYVMAACSPSAKSNRPMRQTRVVGLAPLNGGGTARVLMLDDSDPETGHAGQVLSEVAIPSDGNFIIDLEDMRGNLAVEATGGRYKDPHSGNPVSMRDEAMHAVVYGVQAGQAVHVVLNPWSELLYQYARARPGAAEHETARLALEKSLGCEDRKLTRSFPAMPSSEVPLRAAGNGEIAYVHLAAWSLLAENISRELGQDIPMAHLVGTLGAVLSSSGKVEGTLEVVPGKFLPPDILRQRFAQAVRTFLEKDRSDVAIKTQNVANLLSCISRGGADMWGPAGEEFDSEAPVIDTQEGVVLAGPAQIKCVARDSSGVASMSIDANQAGQSYVAAPTFVHPVFVGENMPEASLTVTFVPSALMSGDFIITCSATDRWGNRREQEVHYGLNKGGAVARTIVAPFDERDGGIYLGGEVQITCQCDDLYPQEGGCHLNDASATKSGMRLVSAPNLKSAVYAWDSTAVPDGENTLTCQARTLGFDEPISDPILVHVHNYDPMPIKGRVELETPVRGMAVKAWKWRSDGSIGALLATAEAQDGNFFLMLTNEYQGHILLEATPSQAEGS